MHSDLINQLIAEIESAFSDTPYPGDKGIGDEFEIRRFIGKKWQDVSVEDVSSNDYLHFFWREARRYYLPAYLVTVLRHPELRSDIRYALIRDLSPSPQIDWRQQEVKIYTNFSHGERTAIRRFFEAFEQIFPFGEDTLTPVQSEIQHERREALRRCIEYWQHYEKS